MCQVVMMGVLVLWCVCVSSCTSVGRLAETLNARELQSCLWYTGNAGPYAMVRGVTATGGVAIRECLRGE